MTMHTLLKASQIIGRGLAQQACRIELKQMGGDGVFWRREASSLGGGMWCSAQDWQKWVLMLTEIPEPDNVPREFLACVTTAMLETDVPWLLSQLELDPDTCSLLPQIYPVLTFTHPEVGDISCVLIDWPQEKWQSIVENWSPFAGQSADVSVSLVAGFSQQTADVPQLPPIGSGIWLDGDVRIERGEALLWCNGPLAKVTLVDENQGGKTSFMIEAVCTDMKFMYSPVLAEIATVRLPLSHLGGIMQGEKLTGLLALNGEVRLCVQNDGKSNLLGTASLLRSGTELLAQINSTHSNVEN
ncbi:hypothetical protein HQQ94_14920 [Shewanella sp. VB17]|uniref:hypothetical protein n=1 Tax=Shewanella sp. VB17 TaxID=2739432 RepID=UPI0015652AA3|nr:hypothetical protein [Shewanella sp. VB17]NRD74505.1 hypothetical protein [Shewanella sp. VB17]